MSRRKRNHLIKRAYSQDALARVCLMPEEDFAGTYGLERADTGDAMAPFFCFQDNGARVLAVAHLDTVVTPQQRRVQFADTKAGPLVVSGSLDDRLGAYIVLEMLPKLDITCDVLLTTGEEMGLSTAEFFEAPRDYDWMIEFDRGGTDVVMYQYDDAATRAAVRASGAVVGEGIFSDIGSLEHLGIKGFNWGVGYRDYHSVYGHAFLNETFAMVEKYRRFNQLHADTPMPHVPEPRSVYRGSRSVYLGSRSVYADAGLGYGPDDGTCLSCTALIDPETRYCTWCGECADCGELDGDCLCYVPNRRLYGQESAYPADETLLADMLRAEHKAWPDAGEDQDSEAPAA